MYEQIDIVDIVDIHLTPEGHTVVRWVDGNWMCSCSYGVTYR